MIEHRIVDCNGCDGQMSRDCIFSKLRGGVDLMTCPSCDIAKSKFSNESEYRQWINSLAVLHQGCQSCPLKIKCLTINV
jgi:hypothetical protein